MPTKLKRFAATAAATVAATAGVGALTPDAVPAATAGVGALPPDAAPAAAYNGVCGRGYNLIDRMTLSGSSGAGTVYLAYNGSQNCVVTIRDRRGSKVHMAARVSLAGQPWISDESNYTWYAGPVYVQARHQCIDWGGEIGTSSAYRYRVHCS